MLAEAEAMKAEAKDFDPVKAIKEIADLFTPIGDGARVMTGEDPITGDKLSWGERGLSLLFIIPLAKVGKYGSKGFKFVYEGIEDANKIHKKADKVKEAEKSTKKVSGAIDDIPKNIEDKLTPAQKKSVKKINNNVNDHLTEGDFSGTKRDLEGNPVPKKGEPGKHWDHLDEMLNTHKSLKSSKRSIENSLKNPNLPKDVRIFLQNELKKANDSLKKIDDLFNEFGGIDKWLKK
ncbi:pre-toxin TG domain-containing protein [Listeria immobilis]|nr:polymorphic toxin type 28 domain-containing protein [Listeria immobilis]